MKFTSLAHVGRKRPIILYFFMVFILLRANFTTSLTRDVTKLARVFVAENLQLDTTYQIDEKNCHYITSVMRLKVGSSFRIFNGRDGEFVCDLQSIAKNKKSAQGLLSRQIRSQTEDRRLPIVLYCAPLKKPRMKLLLEKVDNCICALCAFDYRQTLISMIRVAFILTR